MAGTPMNQPSDHIGVVYKQSAIHLSNRVSGWLLTLGLFTLKFILTLVVLRRCLCYSLRD